MTLEECPGRRSEIAGRLRHMLFPLLEDEAAQPAGTRHSASHGEMARMAARDEDDLHDAFASGSSRRSPAASSFSTTIRKPSTWLPIRAAISRMVCSPSE